MSKPLRVHPDVLEIRNRVMAIQAAASEPDHEVAHGLEDDLFADVLNMIAYRKGLRDRGPSAATLAGEALMSQSVKFNRWCA